MGKFQVHNENNHKYIDFGISSLNFQQKGLVFMVKNSIRDDLFINFA